MHTCHRLAKPFVVAALLSSLSCSVVALPTPPTWTSENYKLWYYVDQGSAYQTGYAPLASGTSSPNVSQTHQLGSSYSSGLISFDPMTSTYTMSVHTIGDSTLDDAYPFSSAYMSASFNSSAGVTLYVSYSIEGKALAVANGDYNSSGVESSVEVNGVTKYWLGSQAGLYNDHDAFPNYVTEVETLNGLLTFDLVDGTNTIHLDMDAWSEKYGTSRTEAWLTASFRFSTTPFENPPSGAISEPSGLALFALGLVGLASLPRRRRLM